LKSIRHVAAASVLALGASLVGIGGIGAFAAGTQATDLGSDIQAGLQSGQLASAHDEDTAAEFDVDEGQIEEVDSEEDQSDTEQAETEVTSSTTSEQSSAAGTERAEIEVTSSSTSEQSSAADTEEQAETEITSSTTSEQSSAADTEDARRGSTDGEGGDAGNANPAP
jgi:hypothetical protein